MTEIERVFIHRDGMSPLDAHSYLLELQERVRNGESMEEILDEIGLEPDYFFELWTV